MHHDQVAQEQRRMNAHSRKTSGDTAERQRLQREAEYHDRRFGENTRSSTDKFYAITQTSFAWYHQRLLENVSGLRVLEYGCGPGDIAFAAAQLGAVAHGIDISPVAINQAREHAAGSGLHAAFSVDNAEQTSFADASFDRIGGSGILHHLNLHKAYAEIARLLRPGGRAVFLEPLGHNPLINAYRDRTPLMRTEDEHPLLRNDLRECTRHFSRVRPRFFHCLSLAAVPLRNTAAFRPALAVLSGLDRLLLSAHAPTRWLAWMVVLECER